VYYIPGYDPRGPAVYYRMIRAELERFRRVRGVVADIDGFENKAGPTGADASWQMSADWSDLRVETEFRFLGWHDLTEREMGSSYPARLFASVRTFFWMLTSGLYAGLFRRHWPSVIVASYPAVLIIAMLGLMLMLPLEMPDWLAPLGVPHSVALAIGLVAALGVWWLGERADTATYAWYLANLARSAHRLASGQDTEMEERLDHFAREIIAAHDAAGPGDELIVAGHSCGSYLAVHVMGRVLTARPDFGARLERAPLLVTMGSVHAFAADFGPSTGFHHGLRQLGPARHLDWIDVFAPQDLIGSGRNDPVAELVPDLPLAERRNPRLTSARLGQSLDPERLEDMRWRFFRLHFQFLAATDRPGFFDFHEVMLGRSPRAPLGLTG
jgi:hypothetical protein